jgi:feruloyl-CoA synthase
LFQDLVVAGENRDRVAVMGWVNLERARPLVGDADRVADPARLAEDVRLREHLRRLFETHNAHAAGSERVAAFALLAEPPSLAAGETTDKAYINQRAVLRNRADVVDDLYSDMPSGVVTVMENASRRLAS